MASFGTAGVGMAALSEREVEVLRAVGEHLSNREIGHRLHISERTVESHVSSLLRKLDAADRRALAALAGRAAVGHLPRAFCGLPAAWTSFVGRSAEVERVATAALQHRLVTLLGPGGIGKTRLVAVVAARVSPRFPGGGAFIELVSVPEDRLEQAVAEALGVAEQPGVPLAPAVEAALRAGSALVVLDNCEHILGAAARWVERTLAACPDLVVLCTSREALHVPGERIVVVPPMGDDARRLFLARAADNDTPMSPRALDIDELCRRLEGSPLAIELAAARLPSLGLDGLRAGLDDQLRLLGALATAGSASTGRHRSLRAVLEWSHELLADDERRAFRRLGVFVGASDLDAAAAVMPELDRGAVADMVGRLVDKSMLSRTGADEARTSRWRMLDTVRSYARERLADSGEEVWVEGLRLRWAASTAAKLEEALVADGPWQEGFGEVADDLRAALARPAASDLGSRYSLGMSLGHLTYARFLLSEACSHYVTAAECAPTPGGAVAAWRSAAAVARADQRMEGSIRFLERAATAAELAQDHAAQARALADIARIMGRFPSGLEHTPDRESALDFVRRAKSLQAYQTPVVAASVALGAAWNGRPQPTETAPELAADALILAREADDPVLISDALDALGSAASFGGRHQEAARLAADRLVLLERMPRHDPEVGLEVFDAYHSATEAALAAGDPLVAASVAQRSRSDPLYCAVPYHANSRLALALALLGDFDGAIVCAQDARDSWVRSGRPTAGWMANAFFAAALVEGLRENWQALDEWWELAGQLSTRSSTNEMPAFVALRVELHTGRAAATLLGGEPVFGPGRLGDYARAVAAELAGARGDLDAVDRVRDDAFAQNPYAAAFLDRASGRVHRDQHRVVLALDCWDRLAARFERAITLTVLPQRSHEGLRILAELGCSPPHTPLGPSEHSRD